MVLEEDICKRNDLGTIRIAYFLSTRELADNEPLSDSDGAANEAHRGNLPRLKQMLDVYNRNAADSGRPRIELSIIVCDDDQIRRDFSDLGIPVHQEPSSSFARLRRGEAESNEAFKTRKAAAKAEYEHRLLAVMQSHDVDLVISDRYMRLFGPTFLAEYLGLVLNSHPAILPDNPGATPTANALRNSKENGYSWTGNTLHIIDHGEDTGPPIMQGERTPVLPNDTAASLRARNYWNETPNIYAGILAYLGDPAVRQLIRLRRQLPHANGSRSRILESMERLRQGMLNNYRSSFERFYADRSEIEPGRYRYCSRLMMRRLNERADAAPRPLRAITARQPW